jgi:hypothetical protein
MLDFNRTIENFEISDNFYMIVGMITTVVPAPSLLSLSLFLSLSHLGMFWDEMSLGNE